MKTRYVFSLLLLFIAILLGQGSVALATDSDMKIIWVDKRAEYADLHNTGSLTQNMQGWVLVSEKGNQRCDLGGSIPAGRKMRVFAQVGTVQGMEVFNCQFAAPIWNNGELDPAVLLNPQGTEVSRYPATTAAPPVSSGNDGGSDDCVIPSSGPWPPCATSGGGNTTSPPNNEGGCIIPDSGPWPPCATSGGSANNPPSSPGGNASGDGCVIPQSGPWPPCATQGDVPAEPSKPTGVTGQVISITDGDTFVVNIGGGLYTVRLIGMDTPERGDRCADEATRRLSSLISGKTIQLERDVSETDRFGRLLRYVYVGGTFVNADLVRNGLAVSKAFPPDTAKQTELDAAMRDAEQNRRGCLHNQPLPTPTPTPRPSAPPQNSNCHPSYPDFCIAPPPPDLDCKDIGRKNFTVLQPDPHRFDRDKDGIGCES